MMDTAKPLDFAARLIQEPSLDGGVAHRQRQAELKSVDQDIMHPENQLKSGEVQLVAKRLLALGDAWLKLIRFHRVTSVDLSAYEERGEPQLAYLQGALALLSTTGEIRVRSAASGAAERDPRKGKGHNPGADQRYE